MEKKLGFGCMRLPMNGADVDYDEFNKMMRDMPETVEEEDEESTWNKALTAAASVYRREL